MQIHIPVFKPYLGIDTLKSVIDAFDIGWLGMGSFVDEFEQELAEYIELDGRYVVAVNTGTSALHLAMLIAGVGAGDEVITPSFNNIGDIQAILAVGAKPVLCDICQDNLGIDCLKAEVMISARTKAIIGMDYAGIPCNLDDLYELADRHQLRVIHDAAHSIGSRYKGQRIGSFGDIVTFSFDPVKTITCIDGGALVVNSQEEVEKLHPYRLLGMTQSSKRMYTNNRAWRYDVVSEGFRYHLSNIHANMGISQLLRIEEFITNRQNYCRLYSQQLKSVAELEVPQSDFADVAPFIYYIRVKEGHRDDLRLYLQEKGIDTGIHWSPAHNFSLLQGCRKGDLSVTERVGQEILTLPLHSYMDPDVVNYISSTIKAFFQLH